MKIDWLLVWFAACGVALLGVVLCAIIFEPPNLSDYEFKPDEYRIVYIDGKGYMPEVKLDLVTRDVWYSIGNDGTIMYTHDSLNFMNNTQMFHETEAGAREVLSVRNSALDHSIVWSSDNNGEVKPWQTLKNF